MKSNARSKLSGLRISDAIGFGLTLLGFFFS
jgi:hypothetical protein